MPKSLKEKIVKRLVARGETLCAKVLCSDWNLDFDKVVSK